MKYKSKSQRLTVFLLLAISFMILIDRVVFPDWFYLFKDVPPPSASLDVVNDGQNQGQNQGQNKQQASDAEQGEEQGQEQSSITFDQKFLSYPIAAPVLDRQKFVSFHDWMRDLEDQEVVYLAEQEAIDKKARQDQQLALKQDQLNQQMLEKQVLEKQVSEKNKLETEKEAFYNDSRPKIVIIIDDLGIRRGLTKEISDLPGPLTLSFLPYADGLQGLIDYGNNHGHEAMLHVPMEPMRSTIDPGPKALRVAMDHDEIVKNFRDNLTSAHGYVGVNNHMGSRFTQDRNAMQIIMQILAQEDLYFIDSKTIRGSVAYETAQSFGVSSQERDVFLDHYNDPDFIDQQFALLQKIAKKKGHAIGIGHPYPHTLAALKKWLPIFKQEGLALVPASQIVGVPAESDGVYAQKEWEQLDHKAVHKIPAHDASSRIDGIKHDTKADHVLFQTHFVPSTYSISD